MCHYTAGWNKTHETGWFLRQSRVMLVMDRGDELWLVPSATSAWLKDGKPHQDFDPRKETVTLTPSPSNTTMHVSVQY